MERAELSSISYEHLKYIKLAGSVHANPKWFSIYLNGEEGNVLFHMDVRYNHEGGSSLVTLNSRKNGQWGSETREKEFPFKQHGPTEVEINFREGFEVKVNGMDFAKFPYRYPLSYVRKDGQLCVTGDISITEVKLFPK